MIVNLIMELYTNSKDLITLVNMLCTTPTDNVYINNTLEVKKERNVADKGTILSYAYTYKEIMDNLQYEMLLPEYKKLHDQLIFASTKYEVDDMLLATLTELVKN